MSFIQNDPLNLRYQPGWFLASADCKRETVQVAANHAAVVTKADGSKYVPAGSVVPSNDGNAKGLLYEDVDVSTGAMPGSLVTEGSVYEDRLPASVQSSAKAVLGGITFIANAPATTRPDYGPKALASMTVASAAGTNAGDTAITISNYTPGSGESYMYKVGETAPTIGYGVTPDYTWTAWDGSSDITAATGKKIAIISIKGGKAIAYGSQTVTAKAAG
jgi:hypothetical protein